MTDWKDIYLIEDDVEAAFQTIFNMLCFNLDLSCPIKKVLDRRKNMTKLVSQEIKSRVKGVKICTSLTKISKRRKYFKNIRNNRRNITQLLKKTKMVLTERIFENSTNMSNTTWNLVNRKIGRKSKNKA